MNKTRDKIIEAAIELLQEKDLSQITTREVVNRAGVNISMLHYYYKTKKELFESALNEVVEDVTRNWIYENLDFNNPTREDLENYILFIIEGIYSYPFISKSQIYLYLEGVEISSMSFMLEETITKLLTSISNLSKDDMKFKCHLLSLLTLSLKVSTVIVEHQLEMNMDTKNDRKLYVEKLLKEILPEIY